MQITLRERPGLMHSAGRDGYPIPESAGVEVKELAKEILVHIDGGNGIAPNGVLDPGGESDGVVGIAILNQQTAGKRNLSSSIAFSNQAGYCWPSIQMDSIASIGPSFN